MTNLIVQESNLLKINSVASDGLQANTEMPDQQPSSSFGSPKATLRKFLMVSPRNSLANQVPDQQIKNDILAILDGALTSGDRELAFLKLINDIGGMDQLSSYQFQDGTSLASFAAGYTPAGQLDPLTVFIMLSRMHNPLGDDQRKACTDFAVALINSGANINGTAGECPLIEAIYCAEDPRHGGGLGDYTILQALVKKGVNLNLPLTPRSALLQAVVAGDVNLVRFLLQNGASKDQKSDHTTPDKLTLSYATDFGGPWVDIYKVFHPRSL